MLTHIRCLWERPKLISTIPDANFHLLKSGLPLGKKFQKEIHAETVLMMLVNKSIPCKNPFCELVGGSEKSRFVLLIVSMFLRAYRL